MTLQEKILYHQTHPIKLIVDFGTGFLSTYLLWIGNTAAFWTIFIIPSVIVTALLMRFADLERLKQSQFGKYVSKFMTRKVEATRLAGQLIMWLSAWNHQPIGIVFGIALILFCWAGGFWIKASSTRKTRL